MQNKIQPLPKTTLFTVPLNSYCFELAAPALLPYLQMRCYKAARSIYTLSELRRYCYYIFNLGS